MMAYRILQVNIPEIGRLILLFGLLNLLLQTLLFQKNLWILLLCRCLSVDFIPTVELKTLDFLLET